MRQPFDCFGFSRFGVSVLHNSERHDAPQRSLPGHSSESLVRTLKTLCALVARREEKSSGSQVRLISFETCSLRLLLWVTTQRRLPLLLCAECDDRASPSLRMVVRFTESPLSPALRHECWSERASDGPRSAGARLAFPLSWLRCEPLTCGDLTPIRLFLQSRFVVSHYFDGGGTFRRSLIDVHRRIFFASVQERFGLSAEELAFASKVEFTVRAYRFSPSIIPLRLTELGTFCRMRNSARLSAQLQSWFVSSRIPR